MSVDVFKTLIGIQEFGGGFVANAFNTGDVVARIAFKSFEIGDLFRGDAPFVNHAIPIVDRQTLLRIASRNENVDAVVSVDHLKAVLIACQYIHMPIGVSVDNFFRKRTNHIIGFNASDAKHRQAQGVDAFIKHIHLLTHVFRHTATIGFIIRIPLGAKAFTSHIKGEDECIGLALVKQLKNGVEKAINRPRGDVITISHLGAFQGEIHAIRQCVTVYQDDGFWFNECIVGHILCPH